MISINQHEFEFLTDNWQGPKDAGYNKVYEYCTECGFIEGFNNNGRPLLTHLGFEAVKAYTSSYEKKG